MTTLVMIAILGAGLIGWSRLPISDLPKIDYPTISISASLPGADPETMAATVAVPLERQIAAVSGVDSLSSTSSQGTTQITVQFLLERDIDSAAQDIQAAISRALKQLPPEMTAPPTWQKVNPADLPILLIALHSSTLPMSQLNAYADTLIAQRLSMVNGVAQVSVFGNYKSAVRIKLDPDRLAGRNISIDEVASAVDHENSNHPLGTLWGANKTWTMHTNAGLKNADDFK
ncbi:MAG: efflux RND transporter permease subunit, partial [Planctomycetota bacterium]